MSEHLVRAAKIRHQQAVKRATEALGELTRAGDPITFAAVSRKAGVSTDFLYKTPELRSRIIDLRTWPLSKTGARTLSEPENGSSTSAIRALSSRLKEQQRRHRDEVMSLKKALAAAHGENLELRRRLSQIED